MVLQNYQTFIEITANMIYLVALGLGLKCLRKVHLNTQCTEVRFASFLSGGFTTIAVRNPLERKLAKCTSVPWLAYVICICYKDWKIDDIFAAGLWVWFTILWYTQSQRDYNSTLVGTPSEKLEWKYSELSNFHKIWIIVLHVNDHIEEKLGSEMFR